jgi:hypothetical protein
MALDGFTFAQKIGWRQDVPSTSLAYLSVGGTVCVTVSGEQCDEYPFYASKEGGPFGNPLDPSSWVGFTLSRIDAVQNGIEGLGYQAFKEDVNCGIKDLSTGAYIEDVPFLVIPAPWLLNTTHICTEE